MEQKKSPKAELESKKGINFLIGMMIVLAGVLLAFEWKTYDEVDNRCIYKAFDVDDLEDEIIPVTFSNQPPPPPPPPSAPIQEILEIVDDHKKVKEEPKVLDTEADENMKILSEIIDVPDEIIEEPEFYFTAEEMPIFPGCEGKDNKEIKLCTELKMLEFIRDNIRYPNVMKGTGINGTVHLSYLIDEKGNVTNVQVSRGIPGGKPFDNEAIKVVNMFPKMEPGKQRGKPVKVRYNVPVRFK